MMLIDYLPIYYRDSKVMMELLKAFTDEINKNDYSISDIENQFFINTATWGLDIWEKEWGIYTDHSKPFEERREVIKAKRLGMGTCTIEMIKNTALAYTNADVEVIEHNENYMFVVKFVSVKGIPPNITDFKNTIDTIKPAHLAYRLEYTYTVWNDLTGKTWDELKGHTWDEIKTVE